MAIVPNPHKVSSRACSKRGIPPFSTMDAVKIEEDQESPPAKKPKQTQDQACQVDGIPGKVIFLLFLVPPFVT